MEIRTIGIDLGKTVFHLVGVNVRGEVVVRKKCSRLQLLRFTSNLRECLIGREACGGSHFLGRALREQGHDVRLMPAQYVSTPLLLSCCSMSVPAKAPQWRFVMRMSSGWKPAEAAISEATGGIGLSPMLCGSSTGNFSKSFRSTRTYTTGAPLARKASASFFEFSTI